MYTEDVVVGVNKPVALIILQVKNELSLKILAKFLKSMILFFLIKVTVN